MQASLVCVKAGPASDAHTTSPLNTIRPIVISIFFLVRPRRAIVGKGAKLQPDGRRGEGAA